MRKSKTHLNLKLMIAVYANVNIVGQLPAVTGQETYLVRFSLGNFTETMHKKF